MRFKGFLATLLVVSYAFALVMSTGHLSEWYRLTLGTLPPWFAVGLAAALELSAFLLSLLSNSILKGSRWAGWGGLVALGLVWVGNFFSMRRAGGNGVPLVEVFLSSLFVPVSTYVVAKVLGELVEVDALNREYSTRAAIPDATEKLTATSEPQLPPEPKGDSRPRGKQGNPYVEVLKGGPKTAREIMEAVGVSKAAVYKALRSLEGRGLVRKEGERWTLVSTGE